MKHDHQAVTRTRHQVTLDADDIIRALYAKGIQCHPEAKVTVRVPGGGDWSGLDITIGEDTDLTVTWEEVTHGPAKG